VDQGDISDLVKYEKKLTDEFEWRQSIETFTRSSDRGRYLMVFLVLASFFCTICWLNSRQESWIAGRVTNARRAIQYEVWDPYSKFAARQDFSRLKGWAESYDLYTKDLLMSYLSRLEDMESQSAYSVRIPIIGVSFDINDLGAVVGLSFLFLLLLLLASTYREHENLYLCLWKVERMLEPSREAKVPPDLGDSDPNLLYHSLAMAQVFANPPTLARWRRNRLYNLPYFIFFLPLVPMGLILRNDLDTTRLAEMLSHPATVASLVIQIFSIVLCAAVAVICVLYERSAALRWRSTFYKINPKFQRMAQPRVRDWLLLTRARPASGRFGFDGWLAAAGQKSRLSDLVKGPTPLIFDVAGLPQFPREQLREILAPTAEAPWIRIVVDDQTAREPGYFSASRRFLRRWRARELAFAVVEPEEAEIGSSRSKRWRRRPKLRITTLAWRWDERIETEPEQGGGRTPRPASASQAA
jgi:hypothetical protein